MTHPNIEFAIEYLRERGTQIPPEMLAQLRGLGLPLKKDEKESIAKSIKAGLIHSKEMKQADSYGAIRDKLWIEIYDSVYDYLNGDLTIASARNKMTLAISEAYINSADIAYQDGGGTLPLDDDTASFANGELQAQLGYADSLFTTLKGLKKEGDYDANGEASDRADGYTGSMDALYNSVKTMAAGNTMLTFDGDDGKESCNDCKRYKGQRHRASWWISHNAVPPNRNFECGGYNCEHYLVDDDGKEFTI